MIRHKLVSLVPDLSSPPGRVRPADWNDTHNSPPFIVPLVNASVTWTNMPAAATEFTGLPRTRAELTHADEVRIVVCVGAVGASGATLKVQYSTDQSAWSDLTLVTAALNVLNVRESAWQNVPAGAKADVFLRVLGAGGDGVLDPQFRLVQLQVR